MNRKTLSEAFLSSASNHETGIRIIRTEAEEKYYAYSRLYSTVLSYLEAFQTCGIKPGDKIILQIHNIYKFIITFWACILGGFIPVPLSVAVTDEKFEKLYTIWKKLNRCRIITEESVCRGFCRYSLLLNASDLNSFFSSNLMFDELSPAGKEGEIYPAKAEDTAFIQFSSGSTCNPKGIILSHENLLHNIDAIACGIEIKKTDSSLSWLPLTHDMGLIGFHLTPLLLGVDQALMLPELFLRKPDLWIRKATEYKITIMAAPNSGLNYFINHFKHNNCDYCDLSSVRLIFCGGEFINPDTCLQFSKSLKKYGLKENTIFPVYGLAEASLAVSFPEINSAFEAICLDTRSFKIGRQVSLSPQTQDALKIVSVGGAVKHCELRICDQHNNLLDDTKMGYIQIKGANVTRKYFGSAPEHIPSFTVDGWFSTMDLGFIREKKLYVIGRREDMININGNNIFLQDIEQICLKSNDLHEDRVVAGSIDGELIIFIKFKKDISYFVKIAQEVKQLIRLRTGIPVKDVLPTPVIYRTSSGKLQRYKMTELYRAGYFQALSNRLNSLIELENNKQYNILRRGKLMAGLLTILRKVCCTQSLGPDDNFLEIGIDSIILSDMAKELQILFPGKIDITIFFEYPTIRKLSIFLQEECYEKAE